ncbi:tyrosine-type recombinase/integrase [Amycolatopsis sp. NBC_01286]|uniref:tyrosine-type recombinase/integrase n=1 Tax=Amycolatopsis sp. NBC_01286 TaxID=2903560 RepID=UPI002E14EFAB|nr:tyrosine-type recombinase/integrase [Amycolatopsis sp. NBC_01286]
MNTAETTATPTRGKRTRSGHSSRRSRHRGSIDRLDSGSLRVRVDAGADPITGKRHRPTVIVPPGPDDEHQAEVALTRLLNEVDEQRHPKTKVDIGHLVLNYQDERKAARTTIEKDGSLIARHIIPYIGSKSATKDARKTIRALYKDCQRCRHHCTNTNWIEHRTSRKHECDARCRKHRCKGLANNTVRKIHAILSGAYTMALAEWEWWSVNPIDGLAPPSFEKTDPVPPSTTDAAAIVNEAFRRELTWGVLLFIAMISGARRGEVVALRRRHHDPIKKVLYLRDAIAQLDETNELIEKGIKNEIARHIVLDDTSNQLLIDYWAALDAAASEAGYDLDDDAFFFSLKPDHSTPLRPRSVTQRYRRMTRAMGLDTQLKCLRHFNATELIAAGVDIRTVAGRLGHGGGGSTTLRFYAAWASEAHQRAAGDLAARLPELPAVLDQIERAKTAPEAPFERVASRIRSRILAGDLADGSVAPSIKEVAATYEVAVGTAHRAADLLRQWGMLSAGGRGKRPLILRPAPQQPTTEQPKDGQSVAAALRREGQRPLNLELHYLGSAVKVFAAEADPADARQLDRLLRSAVRRHTAGADADIGDFELIVRNSGEPTVVTAFVSL